MRLVLALAATGLLAAFMPWHDVFVPDDEGFELMKAWLLQRGHPLYAEIWSDQPPLHTWLLAAAFHLFGPTIAVGRALALAFTALACGSLVTLVARRSGTGVAALALLGLLLSRTFTRNATSVTIMLPAIALALFAVVLIQPARTRGTLRWLIAAGAVFGLALQIKFIAVVLLPLALVELLRPTAPRSAGGPPASPVADTGSRSAGVSPASPATAADRLPWAHLAQLIRRLAAWGTGATLGFATVLAFTPAATMDMLWTTHLSANTRTVFGPGGALLHGLLRHDADLLLLAAAGLLLALLRHCRNSVVGEHTRPGCSWMRPRIQPGGAPPHHEPSARPETPPVFREGAENHTRGGCAPRQIQRVLRDTASSEYLAPFLLLLVAYAGHCWLRPFWAYYYLHLALPLAWLVALATRDLTNWVATAQHRRAAVVRFLLVAALFTTVLVRLPERVTLARDALRLGPPAASAHLLQTLREHPGEWVFVNQPAIAFQAGVLVPPEAVVLSLKRLWLGRFTEDDFLRCLERRRPVVVQPVMGLPLGPAARAYLAEHYDATSPQPGLGFYLRRPPAANPRP